MKTEKQIANAVKLLTEATGSFPVLKTVNKTAGIYSLFIVGVAVRNEVQYIVRTDRPLRTDRPSLFSTFAEADRFLSVAAELGFGLASRHPLDSDEFLQKILAGAYVTDHEFMEAAVSCYGSETNEVGQLIPDKEYQGKIRIAATLLLSQNQDLEGPARYEEVLGELVKVI